MGAVLTPKAWESNSQAKLEYLEGLVGRLTQEKLESLESEVKTLTSERDNLRGQLSQYEETVKAIKAEAAARIEAANKSHSDGSSRQRGVWEAKVRDLSTDLNRSEAKVSSLSKEVEILKSENIRLEGELKSKEIKIGLLEEMNSKLDQILSIVKGLAEGGASNEEIIKAVNNISLDDKIMALIQFEGEGCKGQALLDKLRPYGVKAQSRITDLRRNPRYTELGGLGGRRWL